MRVKQVVGQRLDGVVEWFCALNNRLANRLCRVVEGPMDHELRPGYL